MFFTLMVFFAMLYVAGGGTVGDFLCTLFGMCMYIFFFGVCLFAIFLFILICASQIWG